jgi:hypothetical protein
LSCLPSIPCLPPRESPDLSGNARDFRRLVGKTEVHPGLIILPAVDREGTWKLLQAALAFIRERGELMDVMVNQVVEVDESGNITFSPLPSD